MKGYNNIKISIIICTYNVEKRLRKTLDSILAQEFDNYEVIIVDGKSTDKTINILKEYEGKFFGKLKWMSELDSGIYEAMNKGVRMAQGEYLNIIGAGDWLEKDALKNAYNCVIKNTDVDAVQGKLKIWDKNIENSYLLQSSINKLLWEPMQHPALFYKKELHKKFGLYDESYKIVADYLFCMKAFLVGSAKVKAFDYIVDNYVTDGISSLNITQCELESMRAREELKLLPLVSIIVPTYNHKQYIAETLKSVENQIYHNWECIIVDDGSTDGTKNIVEKFVKKDKRFKYIKQENLGPSVARNNGILNSHGEYILPLDSDDIISTHYVRDAIKVFMTKPKTKVVYCRAEFFGERSGEWELPKYRYDEILFENVIFSAAMYRRSDYDKTLGYNSNMRDGLEDWDFWLSLLQKEDIVYKIPKVHFFYRISKVTRNIKSHKHDKDIQRMHKQIFLNHKEKYKSFINPIFRERQIRILQRQFDSEKNSLKQIIEQKNVEIQLMQSSKFWKIRNRYLKLRNFNIRNIGELAKRGWFVLKEKGPLIFFKYLYKYLIHGREYFKKIKISNQEKYEKWINKNERWNKSVIKKETESFKYKPKISIITPVYNINSKWLNKCIESVKNQFYENWELCLHDDASTNEETIECLKKWEKMDSRIKISYGEKNQHISGASNEALKFATGEYIALLDNDDKLSPDALYESVKLLNKYPRTDFIYSDEDKIDKVGRRTEPFFKPDWSPDLFLSMNYTCHLGVYRKTIIDEIGGFRKGYEGAQDYDLTLRFVEKTKPENIFHISKILYHWRQLPSSTASHSQSKSYSSKAAIDALKTYLERNNINGNVFEVISNRFRIKRIVKKNPLVSIIIPFKDQVEVLKKCIDSILEKTDYENYEILLVDNQSVEMDTKKYLEEINDNLKIRILEYGKPFNFSAINNFAVKKARGEFILFLNNDTEVISKEWLSAMMEHIQREEVGAVGAKLLYPDDTVQHAGVILLGKDIIAGHAFKYLNKDSKKYFDQLNLVKNYSAVTAACLLTKKKLFEEIGGFDEQNLRIAYNDVDLCLKIRKRGYLIVYTPFAELYHHESLSRGDDEKLKYINPEKYKRVISEREYMRSKWKNILDNDPYLNMNLSRKRDDFEL